MSRKKAEELRRELADARAKLAALTPREGEVLVRARPARHPMEPAAEFGAIELDIPAVVLHEHDGDWERSEGDDWYSSFTVPLSAIVAGLPAAPAEGCAPSAQDQDNAGEAGGKGGDGG